MAELRAAISLFTRENELPGNQRIRSFEDPETKTFLEGVVRVEHSVPFLGAGFTGGERARGGLVPFGGEWLNIMRKQILAAEASEKPSAQELANMSFQDVSDVYFSYDIVPIPLIKETLNNSFSDVHISHKAKLDFLKIEWPYVYTLNVDDAIEKAIDGIRILPYKKFAKTPNRRFVYKLHGDIEDLLAAPNRAGFNAVFGKKQYIDGLERNESMLADLSIDFAEKNLLFIGCSLSEELDVLFALARAEKSDAPGKGAKIFVTSKAPEGFEAKKKMDDYGITDVVITPEYGAFYSFLASAANRAADVTQPLATFAFEETPKNIVKKEDQIRYLIQAGWKGDPYQVSIQRSIEVAIQAAIETQPVIAVWGRRFSGRTSLLYRILNEYKKKRRFFIPSTATISSALFNQILRVRNALIVIDSNSLRHEQLRLLAGRGEAFDENDTVVIAAMSRADLNTLGRNFDDENAVFELDSKLDTRERKQIDSITSPLGYQKWSSRINILDNIFTIAKSPISTATLSSGSNLNSKVQLASANWSSTQAGKLQFMAIYYLAVRHRMYSRAGRALAKAQNSAYLIESFTDELVRNWQPFIEIEDTDPSSKKAENSDTALVSNSFAWLCLAIRSLSEKAGANESAALIAELFSAMNDVDNGAFDLILYDNLNAVYEVSSRNQSDWRGAVIRRVYENLATTLSAAPDYWLQRAKAIYYISNVPDELRIAAAYCEKGIVERAGKKTWANAKLTKANILGKLCSITQYKNDNDIFAALEAYRAAIEDFQLNQTYIDELLSKSKNGRHYMSKLAAAARGRAEFLEVRDTILELDSYLQ